MTTTETIAGTTFTTRGDRELVVTRVVDAGLPLTWDAWTSAQHVPEWMLGPEGWTMPECEIDLRPGGAWRFVYRRPDGDEMELRGEYREVDGPRRLVATESWGGDWPDTVNTLELAEADGGTRITSTVRYPSREAREAALGTGMKEGWAASLERLDEHLRGARERR